MKNLTTFSKDHQVIDDKEASKIIEEDFKEYLKNNGKSPEDKKYLVLLYFPSEQSYGEDDRYFEIVTGRTKTYKALKDLITECNLDIHESIVIVETVTLQQALSDNNPDDRMTVYKFMKYMKDSGYFDDSFDIEDYNVGYYDVNDNDDNKYV